ncbi:sporulation protein YunB [Bacillus sp. V3-13]|uniref:sporulation protein YunB n=1 Tax=Bacillus sp. V3-13 TaxID=2053728 RepID=UPI000C77F3C5|nr:sporulation protein YunB [Bacillus sp. V3-13]PLR79335.1 sporulation protein YunB [Bacillus sp. V3-13]
MFKPRRKTFKQGPLPVKYVFMITFIMFIGCTFFSLIIINKNIEPALKSIAETRSRQFAAQAINDAISHTIVKQVDIEKLIISREVGEDAIISFNPQMYSKLIADATIRVQEYLDLVEAGELEKLEAFKKDENIDFTKSQEQKGIVYNIPLGMATNITLFSNLGPEIPVRFEIIGAVTSDLETKYIETGINNTIVEVYIKVKVHMNVIIPLLENQIEEVVSVKIGEYFHPGKVPQFYNNGEKGGGPSIELPSN